MQYGLKSSTMKLSDPALTSGSSSESHSWNTNSSSGLCSNPAAKRGVSLEERRLLHEGTQGAGHLLCPHLPRSPGSCCVVRRQASRVWGSPGLTEGRGQLVTSWAEAELSLPLALITQRHVGFVLKVWSLKAVIRIPGVYQRDRIPHPIIELMNQNLHSNHSPPTPPHPPWSLYTFMFESPWCNGSAVPVPNPPTLVLIIIPWVHSLWRANPLRSQASGWGEQWVHSLISVISSGMSMWFRSQRRQVQHS